MMEQQTIDANVNAMQCVVAKHHFGYDVIHNVCSGAVARIEWALGDWVSAIGLGILGLILLGLLLFLGAMFTAMARDGF